MTGAERERGAESQDRGPEALDRANIKSISDYRDAAAGCFNFDETVYFSIWATQIEIYRAIETLAARKARPTVGVRRSVPEAQFVTTRPFEDRMPARGDGAAPRRRPGNIKHDPAVTSFLLRCVEHVETPASAGEGGERATPLTGLLDEYIAWRCPTRVRIRASVFDDLFLREPVGVRARFDRYDKARELARLAWRVAKVSRERAGASWNDRLPTTAWPPNEGAESSDISCFHICVGWQEQLGAGQKPRSEVEVIGGPFAGDRALVLHQLAGLTGYDLRKCWADRRGRKQHDKDISAAYKPRWTSVLLRSWLAVAAGKSGGDGELKQSLATALSKIDTLRAHSKDPNGRVVPGTPVAFLWLKVDATLSPNAATLELEDLWKVRGQVEVKFGNPLEAGRVKRKLWTQALKADLSNRRLDPHEYSKADW